MENKEDLIQISLEISQRIKELQTQTRELQRKLVDLVYQIRCDLYDLKRSLRGYGGERG